MTSETPALHGHGGGADSPNEPSDVIGANGGTHTDTAADEVGEPSQTIAASGDEEKHADNEFECLLQRVFESSLLLV